MGNLPRFNLTPRLRSFLYAWQGLRAMLATQPNSWVHLVLTLLVIACGAALGLDRIEWALLVLAMALVWTAEALNTAVEWLGDAVASQPHPLIGRAKDVASAAVLAAAVGSVIIGLLVFGPRLWRLWTTH